MADEDVLDLPPAGAEALRILLSASDLPFLGAIGQAQFDRGRLPFG